MNRIGIVLLAALAMVGCATTNPGTGGNTSSPTNTDQVKGASNMIAVCVGLTLVDPAANGGWSGECPGCDVDARGLYSLFTNNGYTAKLLLNSAATWSRVRPTILDSAKDLKPGDLLVVTMSGHGGQIADDNGDEKDKLDETICLWDGQVRDDEILKMIGELPPGVRLVLINDQCHSEGNFRSVVRMAQRAITLGAWGKKQAKPIIGRMGPYSGQLIQFAGCREASYSYGANDGGTWTQSLLATYNPGITWKQWFDQSKAKMPGNQVPQWVEYGDVNSDFRDGPVLK